MIKILNSIIFSHMFIDDSMLKQSLGVLGNIQVSHDLDQLIYRFKLTEICSQVVNRSGIVLKKCSAFFFQFIELLQII